MFKINDFISSINQKGVARTNRYRLQLSLPPALNSIVNQSEQRDISLRAESVQFPGYAYQSYDVIGRVGYGPAEKYPYVPQYDDITITFLVDKHMDVYNLFYEWHNLIINSKNNGQSKYDNITGSFNSRPYELTYRDDYVSNGILTVMDPSDKTVMIATIYRMWPQVIPSIDMSWGTENEVMRIAIPFNYADFTIERGNIPRTTSFSAAFQSLNPDNLDVVRQATEVQPGAVDISQITPARG